MYILNVTKNHRSYYPLPSSLGSFPAILNPFIYKTNEPACRLNLHKEGSLPQIYLLQIALIQDAAVLFAALLFKASFLSTRGAVFCLWNKRQQNIFYHYCCQQCFSRCTFKLNLTWSSSQKATLSNIRKAGICAAGYTYLHRAQNVFSGVRSPSCNLQSQCWRKASDVTIYNALPNWSAFLSVFEKKS